MMNEIVTYIILTYIRDGRISREEALFQKKEEDPIRKRETALVT